MPTPPEDLAREIAAKLGRIPQVLAVAMSGSTTSGNRDERSDIDLYAYAPEEVPLERRREIAEGRGVRVELDNRFWETGDEWDVHGSGIHVDVVFRSPAFAEDSLARVLRQTKLGQRHGCRRRGERPDLRGANTTSTKSPATVR